MMTNALKEHIKIELPAIDGLTVTKREGDQTEIAVGPQAGDAQFLRLLFWLPTAHELSFYDQYFPGTRNDPGAYVDVQRKNEMFQYRMGNHGWFHDWSYQSPELLAALMVLNLRSKPGNPEPLTKIRICAGAKLPRAFARE